MKKKRIVSLVVVLVVSLLVVGCFNFGQQQKKTREKQAVNSQVSKLSTGVAKQNSDQIEEVVIEEGITVKILGQKEMEYEPEKLEELIDHKIVKKLFTIKNRDVNIAGDTAIIKGGVGKYFKSDSASFSLPGQMLDLWLKTRLPAEDTKEETQDADEGFGFYQKAETFNLEYPAQWVKVYKKSLQLPELRYNFETLVMRPAKTNAGFIVANRVGKEVLLSASQIIEIFDFFCDAEESDSVKEEFPGFAQAKELNYKYDLTYYPLTVKIKAKEKEGEWVIVRIEVNKGEKDKLVVKNKLIAATNRNEERACLMLYKATKSEYSTYLPKIERMIASFELETKTKK